MTLSFDRSPVMRTSWGRAVPEIWMLHLRSHLRSGSLGESPMIAIMFCEFGQVKW
jgi:hypothetical protein